MDAHLNRPYISVPLNGKESFGGSQMWSPRRMISQCACGPIAAFDLLNYVFQDYGRSPLPFSSREDYVRRFETFQKKFFPWLYPNGINGIVLAFGLNRAFRYYDIPMTAVWSSSEGKLLPRISRMLSQNLPVILSVGPHFPAIWKKTGIVLYRKKPDGTYAPSGKALSHYVTVTALHNDWMTISSWGNRYEISIPEYMDYIHRNSIPLFSNILYIKCRKRG